MGSKPDLREQLGTAVNSSTLKLNGHEGPLERIAALGMAILAVQLGADREGQPVAGSRALVHGRAPDRQNVVAGELAGLIWHIKYGRQETLVPRAIALFAEYMTWRSRLAQVEPRFLAPFATQALHEWLSERCQACGGSGKLERTRSGAWVRPRGAMQRNAVFRECTACNGSRRAPPPHAERRRRLGLTAEQYEEQGWARHFNAALAWLSFSLAPLIRRPLARELERRG